MINGINRKETIAARMMDTVKLKTPNWGPLLCQGLYELYKEKIGFNVAIYGSDGGILDAHACILMAVSPTLKTWLTGDPIQGCYSVEIDTISCEIWTILLDFIYTGSVVAEKNRVPDLLAAAEKLQMQPLVQACKQSTDDCQDLPPLINRDQSENGSVLQPVYKPFQPVGLVKKLISSTVTPIQPHQDAKMKNPEPKISPRLPMLTNNQSMPNMLPPKMTSQVPGDMQNPANKNMEQSKHRRVPVLGELPLDLSRDASGNTTATSSTANSIPTPDMKNGPGSTDPQMQAVMTVYYNQMLQYSMLAQKMQHGGAMPFNPKMPNGGALPPGMMPPMMPNMMGTPPFMQQQMVDDGSNDGRQRKFPCSICGMLFFTRHVKEQHELTHTNLKPYGCNICGFRARQKAVIWRHKKNRHPEADSSVSMDALTLHNTEEDTENELNNEEDMNGGVDDSDEAEEEASSMIKPFGAMSDNGEASIGENSAVNHNENDQSEEPSVMMMMSNDPEKPFMCVTCGKSFKNKYILSQHQMIHSDMRRYACDICGFRAKQMSVIYNHKRNKHFGESTRPDGENTLMSPTDLQSYELPDLPFKKAFETPNREGGSMTDIEEEVKHAPRTEDGFLCKLCGRTLKSKIILQEHMMTHYNIRRYSCCYCNYSAKQRAGLYNHMKVKHKGMRPIWPSKQKKRSPFKFGSPSVRERLNRSFQERQKTNVFHVGLPRKHPCRTCGKTFRMKNTLEKHELIHMNIKRYSCKYCGYKAKQKALITRHCASKHPSMRVRISDLYSNRGKSPLVCEEQQNNKSTTEAESSPEVHDLSIKPLPIFQASIPKPANENTPQINGYMHQATALSNTNIFKPEPMRPNMPTPPMIKREQEEKMPMTYPYMANNQQQYPPTTPSPLSAIHNGGGGVTMLNGNVGILQLELPKAQREALESPNTNFPSYGTPEKPHRCKTCGRCFRLRHVMEQHELTHFNFRKYMCDICGFRAKQKAVIYRHKKVKHPNHPGAGRVTLVPEFGMPYARPIPQAPASAPQLPTSSMSLTNQPNFMGLAAGRPDTPVMNLMMPQANSLTPSPLVVMPKPEYKLSPSDNPEFLHNNNKRPDSNSHDAASETVQDLSMPSKSKMEDDTTGAMDMRVSNSTSKPQPMVPDVMSRPFVITPANMTPSWFTQPRMRLEYPGPSPVKLDNKSDDDDDSSLKSSENLASNMAMGLPSMVSSTQASFMSLPPLAPLSPESNSVSPNGNTPDKKYSCQVCGRSFKHRHVLEQHYITHTGLRPYKCEFCDFCARQKASLWRHKQKHLNQHQQLA